MVAVRKRALLTTAVIAVAVLPSACGNSRDNELSPATKRHAYAEAKDVCRELGLDRVASEYKSAHTRDAAARAYAKNFLEPYRASVYRGCRAGLVPVAPEQVPCAQLNTRHAAHELAAALVDRVVAPEGQSQRQTIGIIGESLYATCRQPRLPGVANVEDYKPVKPVLAEIQRDFDQDEIAGH